MFVPWWWWWDSDAHAELRTCWCLVPSQIVDSLRSVLSIATCSCSPGSDTKMFLGISYHHRLIGDLSLLFFAATSRDWTQNKACTSALHHLHSLQWRDAQTGLKNAICASQHVSPYLDLEDSLKLHNSFLFCRICSHSCAVTHISIWGLWEKQNWSRMNTQATARGLMHSFTSKSQHSSSTQKLLCTCAFMLTLV